MRQNKLRLRQDDEIEFKAVLKETNGRIELFAPRYFNFYLRCTSKPMLKTDLLVSLNTATTFNIQHKKCKKCRFSIIPKIQNNRTGKNRILICSKGIQEPEICIENLDKTDSLSEYCDNNKSKDMSCNKTL
jgi:hypothetical protein